MPLVADPLIVLKIQINFLTPPQTAKQIFYRAINKNDCHKNQSINRHKEEGSV